MPLHAVRPRTTASRATARHTPLGQGEAEVLRIVADARTPVFVTVREGGRRRYSYWRPLDSATGRGGCYVALPTAECDALHAAGRITLGDPVADPARTTYRVRAARTPAAPLRAVPRRERAA
ncbi:hypothetical protein ACIGW1_19440 [Streptomyces sp. NPDC053780]|uniref:hypothetical protein n=1 Tax=unclassified Streptomyces TaxID=2593676 RepID=UPI000F735FA6|nr:hypothetical protein [Streptomyces sp. WAC 04229]RSN59887.1 hypothetical protein DMH12_09450 [Streptomyces sp. WAC 04229]